MDTFINFNKLSLKAFIWRYSSLLLRDEVLLRLSNRVHIEEMVFQIQSPTIYSPFTARMGRGNWIDL